MESGTYHSLFKERPRITLELGNNLFFVAVVIAVQAEPDTAEVKFLDEALANVVPLGIRASRLHSAKGRPISIVQQNFEARLLAKLALTDAEDDNASL